MNTEEIIKELEKLIDETLEQARINKQKGLTVNMNQYQVIALTYEDAVRIIKKHTEEEK